jgi:hypothetical protein
MLCGALCGTSVPDVLAQDAPSLVHGLWIWSTTSIVNTPERAAAVRDFCQSQSINEVYASFSAGAGAAKPSGGAPDSRPIANLIAILHQSSIRVEALLSSTDADEPGEHREKLLDDVRAVLIFNRNFAGDGFDGIHLDIEPQQRPENKGAGNLGFLPNLADTYRAVRALAEPASMKVDADIPSKFLKGERAEREMLLSALPRLTLMLYELSNPGDGQTTEAKIDKLRGSSLRYLDMAYQGLDDRHLAKMGIALRSPDYEELLPRMFQVLDETLRTNPHYLGWAWHSYNDQVKPIR